MPRFLAFLAIAWLTFGTGALAETFRLPKTGAPAFVVDSPPGSTGRFDEQGNLAVQFDDRSAAVQYSIIGSDEGGLPFPEIASRIFKAAGTPPYTHTEPGAISGVAGQSFSSLMTVNGVMLDLTVTIVKLDGSQAAVLAVLRQKSITPAQQAAVDALVLQARIDR